MVPARRSRDDLAGNCLARRASAQDPFYAGKTITLIVGYSAGGGYDQYARMLARHYGRHIPGNPNVIVQNMPGAASMTSVRYLDATAPKDGTVITSFDPGLITQVLTADKPVVNFANFQWIGTLLRDIRICYAWHTTGIKTIADTIKRKEFLIGVTAKGSNAYVNGAILRNVLKVPVRQIAGYPGSAEQRMALERGELEGNCGSWTAMPPDWLVQKKINPLLRFSQKRPADMAAGRALCARPCEDAGGQGRHRHPQLAGRVGAAVHCRQTGAGGSRGSVARGLAGDAEGRGVPRRRKEADLLLDPVEGEEAEKIMAQIYAAPPDLIRKAKAVLGLAACARRRRYG